MASDTFFILARSTHGLGIFFRFVSVWTGLELTLFSTATFRSFLLLRTKEESDATMQY